MEGSSTSEVRALGRHLALWLALIAISTVLVVMPGLPIAAPEPQLSRAVGAVSGVIGLALLQCGILRFRLLRPTLDLHLGLAFGVLALGHLFTVWARGPTETGDLAIDVSMYVLLLSRTTAAVLFLSGLALTDTPTPTVRSASTVLVPLGVLAAATGALVLGLCAQLPVPLDSTALNLLHSGRPIPDFLPGQAPGLIAANAVIALAMCPAAAGYAIIGWRQRDPYLSTVAAALALLFFGQLQAVLFPSFASDYITTADAFRLGAYGLLVSNLVWRTAADVIDSTSRNERLRLSQELHDGLAQQLALLSLHLGQAAEAVATNDPATHHLNIAQRLVECASLETRQAITALRTDRVTFEALDQALTAFADEFSENHGVAVHIETEAAPGTPPIDGVLERQLLRILHEACSNAIRHGQARYVWAYVKIVRRTLSLEIRDDGHGFDPGVPSPGLGLRVMAERVQRQGGQLLVEAEPGRGTAIHACLPLRACKGR